MPSTCHDYYSHIIIKIHLFFYFSFLKYSSNTNSLDDNNSSLSLNFTVLTNDGMSNKRISSPMSSNRGQSKSNSNSSSNSSNMERLQRSDQRTNGTIKTSSSYDNMRMTVDNANSDIDGLRINPSSNGSSKVNFR